jgi:hypothetical protein
MTWTVAVDIMLLRVSMKKLMIVFLVENYCHTVLDAGLQRLRTMVARPEA